jgi:hypothetical protein
MRKGPKRITIQDSLLPVVATGVGGLGGGGTGEGGGGTVGVVGACAGAPGLTHCCRATLRLVGQEVGQHKVTVGMGSAAWMTPAKVHGR